MALRTDRFISDRILINSERLPNFLTGRSKRRAFASCHLWSCSTGQRSLGRGGGEGKKESLGDYALKNKLKCHPRIKKHWLAVTINFLTETRPTVSKCFNLPIATICKGAGSNGFAIKTKTGKEIAKLAKELICKP